MTIDEFIKLFRYRAPDMMLHEDDTIRGVDDGSCPLTSITASEPRTWRKAARLLGLDPEDAKNIVMAADAIEGYDRRLRRLLLRASGLA